MTGRKLMRAVLVTVGCVLLAAGVLFAAQGTGIFPYPRSSFMVSETSWVWKGAAIAVLGAVLAGAGLIRRR
jgi:hypothetical protein